MNDKNEKYELEYVKCNLCGEDNAEFLYLVDGFKLVKCNNCGLIYINPRIKSEQLNEFYQDYFANRIFGLKERMAMYKIDIKDLEKEKRGGKILDVGCDGGFFLNSLGNYWEKYGCELNINACQYAKKEFGLDNIFAGDLLEIDLPEDFFDVVHIRGTIEHLKDPRSNLEKMYKLLKNDGLLSVSTTPNIDSLAARIFKSKFRLAKGDEHIYYFSPKTIAKMLELTGFKVKRIFYPYFNTPYSCFYRDLPALFINKILGKPSPPFYGSCMTVYAEKKAVKG